MNGRLASRALWTLLVLVLGGWFGPPECRADLTIQDILDKQNGMITVGPFTFTFTANSVTSDPDYGTYFKAPTAATIDVATVDSSGLTFTFNPMLNLTTADAITRKITIAYTVTAAPGIGAAGLSFSGFAGDPNTKSDVTETFTQENESLEVFTMQDNGGKTTGQNNQSVSFDDRPMTLTVTNTGLLTTPVRGNGATSTAQVTSITNTFTVAPEPSSFAVVSIAAMVGLGAWCRDRRRDRRA